MTAVCSGFPLSGRTWRGEDPFVVIADGRCPFTVDGLLGLADLVARLRAQPGRDEAVRRITP
jgi:hypothetical protein